MFVSYVITLKPGALTGEGPEGETAKGLPMSRFDAPPPPFGTAGPPFRRSGAPKKRGGAPKKRVNGSQRRHEDVAAAVLADDDDAEDQADMPYAMQMQLAPAPSFPPYTSPAAATNYPPDAAGWQTLQDPSSGASYYYNAATQQSSWSWPPESASAPPAQLPAQPHGAAPPPSSMQMQLAPAPSLQPYAHLGAHGGGGPAFAFAQAGLSSGLGGGPGGGPDSEGLTAAFAQRFSALHAEVRPAYRSPWGGDERLGRSRRGCPLRDSGGCNRM